MKTKRERQLRKTDGDFSDFVAWQEWFEERNEFGYLDFITEHGSTTDQIFLYGVFCDCSDETAKARKR